MRSIKSRFVIVPLKKKSRFASFEWIFQLRKFTGLGSEGVKICKLSADIGSGQTCTDCNKKTKIKNPINLVVNSVELNSTFRANNTSITSVE